MRDQENHEQKDAHNNERKAQQGQHDQRLQPSGGAGGVGSGIISEGLPAGSVGGM
jgi:hypothetical protein